MNSLALRSLTIQKRLFLMIVVLMIIMMIPLGYVINQYESDLMTAKQTKTRHLVETVYSLIEHYHKLETSGALSEQQAQELSLDQISAPDARALLAIRYP